MEHLSQDQAYSIVRDTFNDDMMGDDILEDLFVAIYERPAEEDDREVGLWSLICAATPGLCGCVTRMEHEAGGCQ